MNTDQTKYDPQKLEKTLIRVRNAMPSEIDQIARELSEIPRLAEILVKLMGQEQFVKECYHLLTRISVNDSIILQLESLFDSPNELVRRYAMFTLTDMPDVQKSTRVRQELAHWLQQIPYPPKTETDCIRTMKIIESLVATGSVEVDVADRLQAILFFIPRGSYQEIFWPKIWIKASRLLSELGFIHKLQEVACSQEIHYLSAAGAIALARNGFMEGSVKDWLASERDYYLLTDSERQELEKILPR